MKKDEIKPLWNPPFLLVAPMTLILVAIACGIGVVYMVEEKLRQLRGKS